MSQQNGVGDVAAQVAGDVQPLEASPLDFSYDADFVADEAYVSGLPDLQNGASVRGAVVALERVGIHNFRVPVQYKQRDSHELLTLETSVTGTVSLEACKKGINMSRIMRTFYEHSGDDFSFDKLEAVLRDTKRSLGSFQAQLMLRFSYPMRQNSLRSGLEGFQYYDVILEMSMDADDRIHKVLHLDFVYSSACPCSFELAEHARTERNKAVVPHSQRSTARVSVKSDKLIWIEDLQELCLGALRTETQVMVKREDEQAFAELNGAFLKFVEDAARLLYEAFERDERILDFKIVCSHQESLHSHDAIAVLVKGIENGFDTNVSYHEFRTLLR